MKPNHPLGSVQVATTKRGAHIDITEFVGYTERVRRQMTYRLEQELSNKLHNKMNPSLTQIIN